MELEEVKAREQKLEQARQREARLAFGRRLLRLREAFGLTQQRVVERLLDEFPAFVDKAPSGLQKQISRAEAGEPGDEQLLSALMQIYGVRDNYPAAPVDPVRRRAWIEDRNAALQGG